MGKKLHYLCMMAIMMVFGMSAYALDKKDGVYQIGTAEDLIAFAELVNGGEAYANAVLTADIDKGTEGTMIGKDGVDYQGVFDGAGHTIKINLFDKGVEGTALFRNVGVNAVVQNLRVEGTIVTNCKLAAGIAAWNSGIIRGCYADINVTSSVAGDATHGGIAAVSYNCSVIENCLAKIVITGSATQNCGGIVGWASGRTNIVNCLVISDGSSFDTKNGGSNNISRNDGNLNVVNLSSYNQNIYTTRPAGASYIIYVTNKWGDNKATTVVPLADLADGKICYQLNNDQSNIAWVQRIGTDPFPVPAAFGSGQVYASGATDCKGTSTDALTYSNTPSNAITTAHQFDKFGICSVCGCFNFHGLERDMTDGALLLKSAEDIDLAETLNRFQEGFRLNLKMVNDIEYTAQPGRYIFNTDNWFHGYFDGQGHELTINMTEMGGNASFIPQLAGRFENVIMHGTISTTGQFAGSVTAHTRNDRAVLRNVFSDIEINASHDGDNTSAGLIGVNETKTYVDNCIYAGDINGAETSTCLAGICGWSTGQLLLTNCAFLGTLNNALGDSKNISRNPSNVTSDNVYVLEEQSFEGESEDGKFIVFESGSAGVESGELAFLLNGKQNGIERFYQKIGEDDYPMPIKKEGALVYASAASYRCDGAPEGETVYSNTPSSAVLPDHQYEDGFCTVCDGLQEDYLSPVDGWFEISNGKELVWWTNYAAKHLDASARLTDDIDMEGLCERWANVGTEAAPFYGNFDGQFHTISNLVVEKPGSNGVGLIAVMNSLPEKGFGGIKDEDARTAEGVYIKNVTLDESCSLLGRGYVALVGMTAPWAGHVNIKGVMMCGDVMANGGPNAAGVFGCVMGSACHVTIDNCGMIGNVSGPKENGSFSGWLGDWAEVTNCFAVGEVDGVEKDGDGNIRLDRYFARYGNDRVKFTNCYALHGTQVPVVKIEDFESGALAWKANGEQFRTSYWYQTIGEDMYPFADPSHGTVIYAAEKYFSVADEEDLSVVATEVARYEENAVEETIATQALLDKYKELLESLDETTTILELADALDTIKVVKEKITENAEVYKAFMDKCAEIKAFLDADKSFEGELRDELEYYLDESDDPSETNPLGTYKYIIEEHTATAEEIKAETERVAQWLQDAIAADYKEGSDVSKLIPNYDFSNQKENWTDGWCTGYGQIKDEEGNTTRGVEAWNVTGDMHQTVEGMKPGYYLVGINGAFRPSDNRYSTNYAAGIYANGVFNYFPVVNEDIVLVNDTVDQGNCNLHGAGALDLAIYDDGYSTSGDNGAELVGYAVRGETGMAIAAMANRYQAYTIASVGEDGKLTIGIKNPGTKYGNDWTGWGALKVIYCGDDETICNEALDKVLENMKERAQTILAYEPDEETPAAGPNFPAALKEDLEAAIAQADGAESITAKAKLAASFSDIFQQIYEGKQAYLVLYKVARAFEAVEGANLLLVEKDDETGEWIETGESIFTEQEASATYEASIDLFAAYSEGIYSTEEALNAESLASAAVAGIIPQKDEDGYYLIGTAKELAAFRVISSYSDYTVKAKLTADIDMSGIAMLPINLANYSFRGVFDGQGHALTNVYINNDEQRTGLFNTLDGATVKNLKLTGEYYSDQKFIGGITGYSYNNTVIENCDVAVKINSLISADSDGNAQDGTHGGLIGVNETAGTVVKNCIVNCPMYGETTNSCGGVVGWATASLSITNTLVLTQGSTVSTSGSNTISRNPDNCSVSNVFFVEQFGDAKGTKATEEQLASGEITYKLNGSKSEGDLAWFQTIGSDATPRLYDGAIVYFYGNNYINEKPNPQLNAFAYNVSAASNSDVVAVNYALNAQAESGAINFYVGSELKYAYVLKGDELMEGGHEVVVENALLGVPVGTQMTYEVDITGMGSLDVLKIGESYKVYAPHGMAINNNPKSKGFGQILLAESLVDDYGQGYISSSKPGALYAFDAGFLPVNSTDGTPGFYGGLDITDETPLVISGDEKFDLMDLRFTEDGRLFVARASGTSNSSVYEINPDNLNEPWKPIFKGGTLDEATGITYAGGQEQNRMAVGFAFEGKGADLKMYILGGQRSDGKANTTDFNCSVYNLGTATEWTGAPSASFEPLNGVYAFTPSHAGIREDGLGGLWFIQDQNTAEHPALKHFDAAEGKEDYSSLTFTSSGRMAVTTDGKYLAIPQGNGKIVLYETTYVPMANEMIYLDSRLTINVSESEITSLAFDYANNLYVASAGSKTLSRYAIPTENRKVVTPAIYGFTVGTESGDPDAIKSLTPALSEGEGAIYNMAGLRVSKAQKGIYIQDGRKVATK